MALEAVSDAELVLCAIKRDAAAFNQLVRRWEKPLYNFALRLTGNREDALDLTQETFFKAYRQLRQLRTRDKFSHWLFKIALNLFYTSKRGSQGKKTVSLEDEIEEGITWNDAIAHPDSARGKDAEADAVERIRSQSVRRAILALNPEQRAAIVLKVFYGMKFEEIAEVVECPVSTVKSRLYAALENLQVSLKEWVE
ncbi:MAG: sigma-70 family RNA polymerase sigma factor [Acidobacteriia bacterium]|nr:sigma-70 family RNA polymerase sigma factor [Terriglobia bacterium]